MAKTWFFVHIFGIFYRVYVLSHFQRVYQAIWNSNFQFLGFRCVGVFWACQVAHENGTACVQDISRQKSNLPHPRERTEIDSSFFRLSWIGRRPRAVHGISMRLVTLTSRVEIIEKFFMYWPVFFLDCYTGFYCEPVLRTSYILTSVFFTSIALRLVLTDKYLTKEYRRLRWVLYLLCKCASRAKNHEDRFRTIPW